MFSASSKSNNLGNFSERLTNKPCKGNYILKGKNVHQEEHIHVFSLWLDLYREVYGRVAVSKPF